MKKYSLSQSIIWTDALIKALAPFLYQRTPLKQCVIIQKYAALHAHLWAGWLCFSLKGRLKGEHLIHIRYCTSHNILWSQLNNITLKIYVNITPRWQCPVKHIKILSSGCVNISIKDRLPLDRAPEWWILIVLWVVYFLVFDIKCTCMMVKTCMNVKRCANTKPNFAIGKQQYKDSKYSIQWIYNYMAPSWLWLSKQM